MRSITSIKYRPSLFLEKFQSKVLTTTVDEPRFVPKSVISNGLDIKTMREEIKVYGNKYKVELDSHPNISAVALLTGLRRPNMTKMKKTPRP